MTTINFFEGLRNKGVSVSQEDTLWINTFNDYVLHNNLITERSLHCAYKKIIQIIKSNQTSKDVIDFLRKYQIDFTTIDKIYQISLTAYEDLGKEYYGGTDK